MAPAFVSLNKRLKGQFVFDSGNTRAGADVVEIAALALGLDDMEIGQRWLRDEPAFTPAALTKKT